MYAQDKQRVVQATPSVYDKRTKSKSIYLRLSHSHTLSYTHTHTAEPETGHTSLRRRLRDDVGGFMIVIYDDIISSMITVSKCHLGCGTCVGNHSEEDL